MKTIFKIAAIAAITALAVISCGPPDLPKSHNEYWDEYNSQFDAAKYTITTNGNAPTVSDYQLAAYADGYTGVKKDNTVTITFPETADVLKKDAITTADLNFISFYTYNANSAKAAEDAATTASPNTATTSLNTFPGWSFDRRNDRDITLKLPAFTVASSNIVIKIDGSAYTYSNGLKLDRDGNGVTGEKGYDDYYLTLYVSGITITSEPVLPENKGWTVTLTDLFFTQGTTDTTTAADLPLASTNFGTPGKITVADYESILNTLSAGFKVESFSNGSWSASSFKGSLDDTTAISRIIAKGFTASHNVAYRVVFEKGSISLETAKEYYGVKQRIIIASSTTSDVITENAKIKKTRIEGGAGLYYNKDKRSFGNFNGGLYHPPVYGPDYTKPNHGYWSPGYTRQSDAEFNLQYNLKDDVDPEDLSFDADDPDNYYQDGVDTEYISRDNPPGTIEKYLYYPYAIPDWDATPPKPVDTTKGWNWVPSTFMVDGYVQTLITSQWTERDVDVIIHSQDSFGGKVVLKLLMNVPLSPPAVGSVTTKYYFKSIDLAAFKNNFKIYSASSGALETSSDIVEIGIEKVEFKAEGLPADTDTVKIKGNNVIYITLDQKYKNDNKDKYFFIGDGFGYADDLTVFSSTNIWDNKGFKVYESPIKF